MVENWIRGIILDWDNEIEWTDDEIKSLIELLTLICEMNNGLVYPDIKIPNGEIIKYKISRINDILDSYAASIIKNNFKQIIPVCRKISNNFSVDLVYIEPTEHTPRINLNLARQDELESLPSIGNKTAARIISHRKKNGEIRRIMELKNIKGISKNDISTFAHRVYLKNPKSVAIKFEANENLIRKPSFKNYVAFMQENNILISKYYRTPKNLKDLIIREIEGITSNLEARKRSFGYSPGIRTSKIKEKINEKRELQNYIEQYKDVDTHAVLLRDSGYYYFVIELLKAARYSIKIIMFFFRFSKDKNHPSNRLMDELIKAKDRGVDIKVILDHQDETDPKESSVINKPALDFLQNNNILVTFDTEEIATHTKLLLVDDRHIVIGSHNWTAGSYFIYRDTSAYINSKKVVEFYLSNFEELWNTYQFHS